MLAIRKDYSYQSISRLDLRILRTHEPVRAKTILLSQNQRFFQKVQVFGKVNSVFWRRILLWIKRLLDRCLTAFEVLPQFVLTVLSKRQPRLARPLSLYPVRCPTPPKLLSCLGSTKKLFEGSF